LDADQQQLLKGLIRAGMRAQRPARAAKFDEVQAMPLEASKCCACSQS
jgi:hypothetical protein